MTLSSRTSFLFHTRSATTSWRVRALAHLLNLSAALSVVALLLVSQTPPVLAQTAVVVDVIAVAQGYRFGDLKGHAVINSKNENIGTLDDLIITHDKALFAILQVGGFLGLGAHLVAVPFDSLMIGADGKTITVNDASKTQLQQLPEFKYNGATPSSSQASSAAK